MIKSTSRAQAIRFSSKVEEVIKDRVGSDKIPDDDFLEWDNLSHDFMQLVHGQAEDSFVTGEALQQFEKLLAWAQSHGIQVDGFEASMHPTTAEVHRQAEMLAQMLFDTLVESPDEWPEDVRQVAIDLYNSLDKLFHT